MTISFDQIRSNRILDGLPAAEYELLARSLEVKDLYLGDAITQVGEAISHLHFPLRVRLAL